ncbi:MAG: hypothetical protein ACJA01_002075, partial [Saprospiraceae bacterium]
QNATILAIPVSNRAMVIAPPRCPIPQQARLTLSLGATFFIGAAVLTAQDGNIVNPAADVTALAFIKFLRFICEYFDLSIL